MFVNMQNIFLKNLMVQIDMKIANLFWLLPSKGSYVENKVTPWL